MDHFFLHHLIAQRLWYMLFRQHIIWLRWFLWEKVVKNSYSISCYNPNLYPIFTKKFKEINKLIIPINHDYTYKSGIILPNLIYSYTQFPNLIYNYIQLHKYIQKTPNRKIQLSNSSSYSCGYLADIVIFTFMSCGVSIRSWVL